jgi:3-isopropylmalate dehydratase large subunit
MISMTERILSHHLGGKVRVGSDVIIPVSRIMAHDGTAPVIANTIRSYGIETLQAADRAVFVFDHYYPPVTEREALLQRTAREFAARYGIPVHAGQGIAHQIMPELGYMAPGKVLVGADSHTCSAGAYGMLAIGLGASDVAAVLISGRLWLQVPEVLTIRLVGNVRAPATPHDVVLQVLQAVGARGGLGKVLEFVGPGIPGLTLSDRFKLANHAVEMGGLSGLVGLDARSRDWLRSTGSDLELINLVDGIDEGMNADIEVNLDDVEPSLALPSSPDNVTAAWRAELIRVDQVFIGSCAGGRLEDLRDAAKILVGKRVAEGVRLLVAPASTEILAAALKEGILEQLIAAGAIVLPPGCGACMGRLGTLGAGDIEIATQNRNFAGRAGNSSSKIYLGSPTTAALAALSGTVGGGVRAG